MSGAECFYTPRTSPQTGHEREELQRLRLLFRTRLRRAAGLEEDWGGPGASAEPQSSVRRTGRELQLLQDIMLLKERLKIEEKKLKQINRRNQEREALREEWSRRQQERDELKLQAMEENFQEREENIREEFKKREMKWEKKRHECRLREERYKREERMIEDRTRRMEQILEVLRIRNRERTMEVLGEERRSFMGIVRGWMNRCAV